MILGNPDLLHHRDVGHSFPALVLEHVKKLRKEQRALLDKLFPKAISLRRLIADINFSYKKEIAAMIGSVDFAEERLAGLTAALRELADKIDSKKIITIDEIKSQIKAHPRIPKILEKLVEKCALMHLRK